MRRPVAFVVLAGVAALLASFLVYSALKKREAEVERAKVSTIEIAVAAHDLPLGSKIDAASIKLARWSRESVPPGAISEPNSIINAFVKSSMVENEPIVSSKLFTGEKTAGVLPLLIPPGMRAMSVPVDEVSDIAGFVLPHARVDVLVAVAAAGGSQKPFSKMVLQNIEVLAVAQEVEGKKDEPEVVKVVTLLVTPQEAEKLALASHEGSLRLAMRNYNDDKIVMTTGFDVEGMLHSYGAAPVFTAQPSLAAPAVAHVTAGFKVDVLRDGKTRQSVSFVKEAMGPTSAKSGAAKDSESYSEAETPGGQDEQNPAPGKESAETPAATHAQAEIPLHRDSLAAFEPNRKTIDVP